MLPGCNALVKTGKTTDGKQLYAVEGGMKEGRMQAGGFIESLDREFSDNTLYGEGRLEVHALQDDVKAGLAGEVNGSVDSVVGRAGGVARASLWEGNSLLVKYFPFAKLTSIH